jgi:hypothetical protein
MVVGAWVAVPAPKSQPSRPETVLFASATIGLLASTVPSVAGNIASKMFL